MDAFTLVIIGAGVWLLLFVFVLALCKMAARGDAALRQRTRARRRRQALGGPLKMRHTPPLKDVRVTPSDL